MSSHFEVILGLHHLGGHIVASRTHSGHHELRISGTEEALFRRIASFSFLEIKVGAIARYLIKVVRLAFIHCFAYYIECRWPLFLIRAALIALHHIYIFFC